MTFLFFKRFISSPNTVGAILPSSKKVAQNISKNVVQSSKPKKYLEIGAGTGALTPFILKKMHPDDHLDIVERDPKLCRVLREKFGHLSNVMIHEISILDFEGEEYDAAISSLPLFAFESSFVDQVFNKFKTLVKKDGHLSYFEYLGFGHFKQACLFGKAYSDFKKTVHLKRSFAKEYCEEIDKIWWNFPPAKVFHCKVEV